VTASNERPFAGIEKCACRSCRTIGLAPVLSLGKTPLANSLLKQQQLQQYEPTFTLEVAFCPTCTLVQLTESVPPEQLFSDYVYFSSFSDTMLRHAKTLADRLVDSRRLNSTSLVVEVASNDGYLLQYYRQHGVRVLGVEPARNIAKVAEERGIPTRCEFFSHNLARNLAAEIHGADVIHANNVLAHVPDLPGFVAGLRDLVKPDGLLVIEAPHLLPMVDHIEFDTIYHEHLSYFSLTALDTLFRRQGLAIENVEELQIHGGSLRIFASRTESDHQIDSSVPALIERERKWGIHSPKRYESFRRGVERITQDLRETLVGEKRKGKRLAAYGASAKGSTLLNSLKLPAGTLDWIADRSDKKQGLYAPGTHLPIVAPERLEQEMPDAVLLLTWNFADEIMHQRKAYRDRGGKFIIPVPQVRFA
jgi:SAM-dependent methyltransferase